MASFIQLFVIAAAITVACGQTIYLNDSARDYYHVSRRELIHQIELVDLDVAAVDARYADRLDVIELQQEQLLLEIAQVNRTLMTQQALGYLQKYCIQRYDSQLITSDQAALKLKICNDKAATVGASLTKTSRSNVVSAKSVANSQLPTKVNSCDKSFPNNQTALQLCYVNSVESATISVDFYLESARTALELSLFNASVASKAAVECSYLVEKDVLETISKTTKTIDNCERGLTREATAAELSSAEKVSIQKLLMGKIKLQ